MNHHYESLVITMNRYELLIHKMKSPNPISLSLRDLAPFAPSCGGPFLFGGPWLSGAWRESLAQRNGLCYRRSKGSSNGFLILIDICIFIYLFIYLFIELCIYIYIYMLSCFFHGKFWFKHQPSELWWNSLGRWRVQHDVVSFCQFKLHPYRMGLQFVSYVGL